LVSDWSSDVCSSDLAVGHIAPEAAEGGPIAYLEDGDLIRMDVAARRLDVVGIRGESLPPEEIARVFAVRREKNALPPARTDTPVLRLYKKLALGTDRGGGFGL
jgi:dihydroxy-acid dehydratase